MNGLKIHCLLKLMRYSEQLEQAPFCGPYHRDHRDWEREGEGKEKPPPELGVNVECWGSLSSSSSGGPSCF